MSFETVTVFVVEDNQGDIDLWGLVLEDPALSDVVGIETNGADAMVQLENKSRTSRPFRLVIADRYVSLVDGLALVWRMTQDPVL